MASGNGISGLLNFKFSGGADPPRDWRLRDASGLPPRTQISSYGHEEWSTSNFPCSLARDITSRITWVFIAYYWKMFMLRHYITYRISLQMLGRIYFWNLGVKGLTSSPKSSPKAFYNMLFSSRNSTHLTRRVTPPDRQAWNGSACSSVISWWCATA